MCIFWHAFECIRGRRRREERERQETREREAIFHLQRARGACLGTEAPLPRQGNTGLSTGFCAKCWSRNVLRKRCGLKLVSPLQLSGKIFNLLRVHGFSLSPHQVPGPLSPLSFLLFKYNFSLLFSYYTRSRGRFLLSLFLSFFRSHHFLLADKSPNRSPYRNASPQMFQEMSCFSPPAQLSSPQH